MATTLFNFGARDFVMPSSAFPKLDMIQNRPFLAFDDTTEWTCYTPQLAMPQAYASGTLTAYIWGMFESETTATDEAVIGVSVEAITSGDGYDMDAGSSFDTENTCEIDPVATAGAEVVGTCTLTTKDSVAAGDSVRFRVARKVDNAADTATDDFRLLFVEIRES
jgi:hypothetical protein